MSLFSELRRRNVFRAATAYVVSAWLVVQVVETLFPIFGLSAGAIRLVVILLAIGFVPAVIGAWVFQLTPDGLKVDPGSGQSAPGASRMLDRVIIVALVLGICYFAIDKFVLAPERIAEREAEVAEEAADAARKGFYGDRSIAVLPFDNMSSDPEQAHFADGVAEEVLNLLARIRELRVISRSSSFALRGRDLGVPEVAEILDVGHVLEGSVRRAGEQVRVTVQLIEARTDTHLWSKTYTETLDDVFRIQDAIAADVAQNLQVNLLQPLPHSRNVHPEAYALVQQVSQIFQVRDKNTAARMYPLARRAHELDPDYPEAVKWLSAAEWMRGAEGLIPWNEALERVEALETTYLELAPDSGYFEASRAFELERKGDFEQAATFYLRSLEKDLTDSEQLRWAGRFAMLIGDLDVAVRILEHASAIDPLNHQVRRILSQALMFRGGPGDIDRAINIREQYLAVASGGESFYSMLLLLKGRPEQVEAAWSDSEYWNSPEGRSYRAMADYSAGRADEALAKLADIEALLAEEPDPNSREAWSIRIALGGVYAWIGDADKAFAHLLPPPERLPYTDRLDVLNPIWRNIVDDPRWRDYREAIGMSQERLDAIEFDPVMPD